MGKEPGKKFEIERANIEISPVVNGYIVKCLGCWYVGNNKEEAIELVRALLENPESVPVLKL